MLCRTDHHTGERSTGRAQPVFLSVCPVLWPRQTCQRDGQPSRGDGYCNSRPPASRAIVDNFAAHPPGPRAALRRAVHRIRPLAHRHRQPAHRTPALPPHHPAPDQFPVQGFDDSAVDLLMALHPPPVTAPARRTAEPAARPYVLGQQRMALRAAPHRLPRHPASVPPGQARRKSAPARRDHHGQPPD